MIALQSLTSIVFCPFSRTPTSSAQQAAASLKSRKNSGSRASSLPSASLRTRVGRRFAILVDNADYSSGQADHLVPSRIVPDRFEFVVSLVGGDGEVIGGEVLLESLVKEAERARTLGLKDPAHLLGCLQVAFCRASGFVGPRSSSSNALVNSCSN